jgi:3-methyladenine DNA glycosylase AlkD
MLSYVICFLNRKKEMNPMNLDTILNDLNQISNPKMIHAMEKRYPNMKVLGIPLGTLRPMAKKMGIDHELGISLYHTHCVEAMFLGCMIMDPKQLAIHDLEKLAIAAQSTSIMDQGLSKLIEESTHFEDILKSWYQSPDEHLRYAGYVLYSSYFRSYPLDEMDILLGKHILETIKAQLSKESLPIQNAMNNAVVMAGLHVPALVDLAIEVAIHIGYVLPRVRKNQCNIQSAHEYIIRYSNQPNYSRVAKLKIKT